jgi:hypothetical protein
LDSPWGDERGLLRSSPDVDVSSVGDRAVLYHRGTRQALVLNPSGSLLWSLLAAGSTQSALAAALVASYPGLGQERATADAATFLAELERHQMLAAVR